MECIKLVLATGEKIPVAAYDIPCNIVAVGTREALDAIWDALTPDALETVAIEVDGRSVLRITDARVDSVQFVNNRDGTFTGHYSMSGAISGESEDSGAFAMATAILMGGAQNEDTVVERASELRGTIEELAQGLSDERALEYTELYPVWRPGVAFTKAGGVWVIDGKATEYPDNKPMKILYGDTLYYFLQPHTTQEGWEPNAAVSLFSPVLPGQDGTEIGEWVQPDSTNPYHFGDRVTRNGHLWESNFNGENVWEPGVYGWTDLGPV